MHLRCLRSAGCCGYALARFAPKMLIPHCLLHRSLLSMSSDEEDVVVTKNRPSRRVVTVDDDEEEGNEVGPSN